MAAAGCDLLSTAPEGDRREPSRRTGGADEKEAPMLADLVKKGELPPLDERLPESPVVVEPVERTGRFGGTIRRGERYMQATWYNPHYFGRASLLEWGLHNVEPEPALAESWEMSADASTYTFTLRKGLQWSDGAPFTADDILFYYTAVLSNEDLSPVTPTWLQVDGQPVEIVKVDDRTVEFRFAGPNGLLPRSLCHSGRSTLTAAHYLGQFHPDHTSPAELDQLVKESGHDSWMDLFGAKNQAWLNPDLPVLGPWRISLTPEEGINRAVLERNPYFWKVDTDGRQLPYVDRIDFTAVEEETLILRASSGEIDFQETLGTRNTPVLSRDAEQNGYRLLNWQSDAPWIALQTNQSHTDPAMRELLQNIDFRAALSHSINRDEMNQVYYRGTGGIDHPVAIPEDPYYVKGTGRRFLEYDPQLAERLLDEIGLDQRDDDGFRLRSDSEPLILTIGTYSYDTGEESLPAYELVKGYWDSVGLRTRIDNMDVNRFYTRAKANEFDIGGYTVAGYMWDIEPYWYVPTTNQTLWAPAYGDWYATGGEAGMEPSPEIQELLQLYEQMSATADDGRRLELGREILGAHDENVWMIGTVSAPFAPFLVNLDLINVKEEAVDSWRTGGPAVTWVEQVSYLHPEEHT